MEKIPTIKDIARRLKINPSTVSRALKGHPSIGLVTTMRVNKIAEELNYHPNQNAIFLKQGKTFTVGVVLPDIADPFYCSILSKMERYSHKKNYNVIFGQSFKNPDQERKILENMMNLRVDGILIALSKPKVPSKQIDQLKRYNIPVVILDSRNMVSDQPHQFIERLFSILEFQQQPDIKA
ncbi:LacI family DNA-binding transcriptional regulator [Pedobacter sp. ISL-68]|uniref:LacI family DNA-binding transcriptional regulator n=1 Tax=unclassified Pedobacter TaxID=2628915 RepID=UPI001BE8CAE2|nr:MULTISPECIES: LacI family DNA-binding transcriptional regulator [unclassified Pedobacter]MBT2560688.1 LacI family DNA-binding transcriptional regulator [Pedobacter sp. ISL-64]MBT2590067.1 LacI family DNA-binding transcriptional regulator [Pedobacter sp. ISL-68]